MKNKFLLSSVINNGLYWAVLVDDRKNILASKNDFRQKARANDSVARITVITMPGLKTDCRIIPETTAIRIFTQSFFITILLVYTVETIPRLHPPHDRRVSGAGLILRI